MSLYKEIKSQTNPYRDMGNILQSMNEKSYLTMLSDLIQSIFKNEISFASKRSFIKKKIWKTLK